MSTAVVRLHYRSRPVPQIVLEQYTLAGRILLVQLCGSRVTVCRVCKVG